MRRLHGLASTVIVRAIEESGAGAAVTRQDGGCRTACSARHKGDELLPVHQPRGGSTPEPLSRAEIVDLEVIDDVLRGRPN